jgi:broad-specificity NMP kinase
VGWVLATEKTAENELVFWNNSMIIHINGWPGVGKKTTGEALSRLLDARFIHNHLLHDVAFVCAGVEGELRWDLYETVRSAAYKALERHPASETFVMTNALCNDNSREELAWTHVVELAIKRRVPLVPVVLEANAEENVRRLQSPERIGKKMTDAAELREWLQRHSIQRPDVPELIAIDVSNLSAEQAARTIVARLDPLRPTLKAATRQHLKLMR